MSDIQPRRVMIDIETLGLEPGAAIVSIGAVEFGPRAIGESFYESVSRESCEDAGLSVDEGTVDWWQDQPEEARKAIKGGNELEHTLQVFTEWMTGVDEVWANSPAFDCELLIEAGKRVGVPMAWEYYQERDYRTLRELPVGGDVSQVGTEHHALDDAMTQARYAASALADIEDVFGGQA